MAMIVDRAVTPFTGERGPPQTSTTSTSTATDSSANQSISSAPDSSTIDNASATTTSEASDGGTTLPDTLLATSTSVSGLAQSLSTPTSDSTTTGTAAAIVGTSTASSETATAQLAQAYSTSSPSGMSSGAIAAAAIIPICVLALVVAVFLLLRRRRRQGSSSSGFISAMKQRPAAGDDTSRAFAAPVLMGNANTAYYTGLDNESEREHSEDFYGPGRSESSGSFAEPPPPYKPKHQSVGQVPLVRLPTGMPRDPASPISWVTDSHDAAFLDSSSAMTRSASVAATDRSINSDLYSDGASLHSAQAARMSIAGANVISQANASRIDLDPFDDPDSPVSSVDGGDTRSLHHTVSSRAISPVSYHSVRWDHE